jgi:hypothetical protein
MSMNDELGRYGQGLFYSLLKLNIIIAGTEENHKTIRLPRWELILEPQE